MLCVSMYVKRASTNPASRISSSNVKYTGITSLLGRQKRNICTPVVRGSRHRYRSSYGLIIIACVLRFVKFEEKRNGKSNQTS